jgi:acyl carrier protein
MNNVRTTIVKIMSKVFEMDISDIPEDAAPGLIANWDSLRHMTLIAALEEEFEMCFTDAELIDLLNLSLIEQIVFEKLTIKAKIC